jgi:hypothetical protein
MNPENSAFARGRKTPGKSKIGVTFLWRNRGGWVNLARARAIPFVFVAIPQ